MPPGVPNGAAMFGDSYATPPGVCNGCGLLKEKGLGAPCSWMLGVVGEGVAPNGDGGRLCSSLGRLCGGMSYAAMVMRRC